MLGRALVTISSKRRGLSLQVHAKLRNALHATVSPAVAAATRIIYGGSVTVGFRCVGDVCGLYV